MKVHIAGDGSDLGSEASNLVGKHAGRRNLDRVVPVVVVVAEGVSEVENRHFRDLGRILGHIKVGRLDRALSDGVRHKEEVKLAINDLRLLNKARVNVGSLRRVVNEVLAVIAW